MGFENSFHPSYPSYKKSLDSSKFAEYNFVKHGLIFIITADIFLKYAG